MDNFCFNNTDDSPKLIRIGFIIIAFNPLKGEVHLDNTQKLGSWVEENAPYICYEVNSANSIQKIYRCLFWEQTESNSTCLWINIELCNVKPGDIYGYCCQLTVYITRRNPLTKIHLRHHLYDNS
jgi:hypothetical protein